MTRQATESELSHAVYGDSGPWVVFVHGWAMNSGVFAEQAEMMKGRYRVLLVDLPGHGSSAPGSGKITVDACAEKVANLIKKLGIAEPHLVGWSLGAQVICKASLILPKGVKSLALVCGSPRFVAASEDDPTGVPPLKARVFREAVKNDFPGGIKFFIESFFDREKLDNEEFDGGEIGPERTKIIEKFLYKNFPPDKESALALLDDFHASDIRPILPGIGVPCLICHGGRDRITPVEGSDLWEGLSLVIRKMVFDGCGHAPFLTRPREFNETLSAFLSGLIK
ncbi:MAG: alpha/beta fold hydrolase [Nitrospinota bacterium]